MASRNALAQELEPFFDEGVIQGTPRMIRSGKEATVFVCEAAPGGEATHFAAKVYRSRLHRSFQADMKYREGRVLKGRPARAVAKKTRFGRIVENAVWQYHEFETLTRLHGLGCSVPKVHRVAESALLMELVGIGPHPAPQLADIALTHEEARSARQFLLREMERWLSLDLVHGDLSEFNILWHDGRPVVIDVPQAVDPRVNPHARDLFEHDLTCLSRYFSSWDLEFDAARLARDLWEDWRHARI